MRACRRWYDLRATYARSCVYPARLAWYGLAGGVAAGRSCSCSRVVFPIDRVDRVSCRQDSRVLTGRARTGEHGETEGVNHVAQHRPAIVWYSLSRSSLEACDIPPVGLPRGRSGISASALRRFVRRDSLRVVAGRGGNGESRGVAWRGAVRRDDAGDAATRGG